jgi:hypothetical protein
MGDKQTFSISYTDPDGQGAAINYERVIVASPEKADMQSFVADYHVLTGTVPSDLKDAAHAARFCCPGDEFTLCTGDPNCNGGPEPKSRLKRALAAVKRWLGIGAQPPFGPGACKLLLKKSVTWSGDRPSCLCDQDAGDGVLIPVYASMNIAGLSEKLTGFCNTAGIPLRSVAFHVYDISLPPALRSPANPITLAQRQLIAIPVVFGDGSVPQAVPTPIAAVQ